MITMKDYNNSGTMDINPKSLRQSLQKSNFELGGSTFK